MSNALVSCSLKTGFQKYIIASIQANFNLRGFLGVGMM